MSLKYLVQWPNFFSSSEAIESAAVVNILEVWLDRAEMRAALWFNSMALAMVTEMQKIKYY